MIDYFERIENKIEEVENALSRENNRENRAIIHSAYHSANTIAKKSNNSQVVIYALLAVELIRELTLQKWPNFKFH